MRDAATRVVRKLKEAGHVALFNGGCVRDLLLGNESKDYDIATEATPEEVLRLFPKGNTVGAHFGVVLVREGDFTFEIATFREDGEYSDKRRPDSVCFADAKTDARRRDFTINGMFLDPETDEVIDHVGGRADIETKTIRAIGDPARRFGEDYLRMMRAVRFATVLDGFEIEPGTMAALRKFAPHITEIAPERIRDELDKIWLSPNRVKGYDLLTETGLMKAILPEVVDLQGCEQPPQWHPEGDVYTHVRIMLELLEPDASLILVWSVLLHDIAKPETAFYDEEADRIRFNSHDKVGAVMAREILKRLRYSNDVIEAVSEAVHQHMKFMTVKEMRKPKLKRFMAREHFEEELELHRVDCQSSNGLLENHEFLKDKLYEFAHEPLIPDPLINGKDLIDRGWKPGPKMGKVLREVHDLQMEGKLDSHEAAIAWVAENREGE